jgi:hypothetical protein
VIGLILILLGIWIIHRNSGYHYNGTYLNIGCGIMALGVIYLIVYGFILLEHYLRI